MGKNSIHVGSVMDDQWLGSVGEVWLAQHGHIKTHLVRSNPSLLSPQCFQSSHVLYLRAPCHFLVTSVFNENDLIGRDWLVH